MEKTSEYKIKVLDEFNNNYIITAALLYKDRYIVLSSEKIDLKVISIEKFKKINSIQGVDTNIIHSIASINNNEVITSSEYVVKIWYGMLSNIICLKAIRVSIEIRDMISISIDKFALTQENGLISIYTSQDDFEKKFILNPSSDDVDMFSLYKMKNQNILLASSKYNEVTVYDLSKKNVIKVIDGPGVRKNCWCETDKLIIALVFEQEQIFIIDKNTFQVVTAITEILLSYNKYVYPYYDTYHTTVIHFNDDIYVMPFRNGKIDFIQLRDFRRVYYYEDMHKSAIKAIIELNDHVCISYSENDTIIKKWQII